MTSDELRTMRKAKGLTQTDLGKMLGYNITPGSRISSFERGERKITTATATLLKILLAPTVPA